MPFRVTRKHAAPRGRALRLQRGLRAGGDRVKAKRFGGLATLAVASTGWHIQRMLPEAIQKRYPTAKAFTFGDSRALCDDLLARVRTGVKTATCGALRDFGPGGEAMPQVGRCDIALEWDGAPACVIETVSVIQCRFDEVDAAFALAEGEGNSLAAWRRDHQAYFTRNGGFSPGMMLVCERFCLVEDLAAP